MLRKIFDSVLSPQSCATHPVELAQVLDDLRRLSAERPELEAPADTLGHVLVAAFGTPAVLGSPYAPDADRLAEIAPRWSSGGPCVDVAAPVFDPADLRARGRAICHALRADNPAAATLESALRRGRVDWTSWATATVLGRPESVGRDAQGAGLRPDLVASVLRLTLLPVLAPCWANLAPHLPEGAWFEGHCPFCGRPPLLAEARGLEQRRFLRCGLCAADWPADRLRCPACGESDHRAILYRFVEGQEARYRLALCETCGFGLKVVSTLAPLSAPGLLVAELATVHLDLIAATEPEASPGGAA
jgi:hypothetical protein